MRLDEAQQDACRHDYTPQSATPTRAAVLRLAKDVEKVACGVTNGVGIGRGFCRSSIGRSPEVITVRAFARLREIQSVNSD